MEDEDCANPLLLGWIKEWLDQAREQGSKAAIVYKKAYDAMKACPLAFDHPSEARVIKGLGDTLCDRLTKKMTKHYQENGLQMPEPARRSNKRAMASAAAAQTTENVEESARPKKKRKAKDYVPTYRSGAYALIMALSTLEEDARVGISKPDLIELAQPHCDSSFTVPNDPSKFYTAWNSMKTLMEKDLIYTHGRPTQRFVLTEEGWKIARNIRRGLSEKATQSRDSGAPQQPDTSSNRNSVPPQIQECRPFSRIPSSASALPLNRPLNPVGRTNPNHSNFLDLTEDLSDKPCKMPGRSKQPLSRTRTVEPTVSDRGNPVIAAGSSTNLITLPPGSFTVELVLDFREVRTVNDRDYISNELIKKGITPIVRQLELGDSFWVAKCKDPAFLTRYGEEGDEVMLDWIAERKRLDDLVASIKDGRFHEQKFRLGRSGVTNVIYLIEEFATTETYGPGVRFHDAIESAIASTQVVNGYFIKKTRNLDDTIRYLARMTLLLRTMYAGSPSSPNPETSICIIPTRMIHSTETYLQLLNRYRSENASSSKSIIYTTTFTTFSTLSSKVDMLCLRDIFLKMLMCTRGVTGDKAIEIQRCWPTPRKFIEAFEEVAKRSPGNSAAVDEMVASRLSGLVGRKKIGKTLSQKIAGVWAPQR